MTDTNRLMVLLEGNIGAGKTTVGRRLAENGRYAFIEEPTEAWFTKYDKNMLELFYSDTTRWAFTFQVTTFVTRAKTWGEIRKTTDNPNVILERSIYCDRHVFVESCYQSGLMTTAEYQLYCDLFDFAVNNVNDQPDLIIYFRTPAEICLERMQNRGRNEEVGVPLAYLQDLERLHDAWLLDNPNVLVLDGEKQWSAKAVETAIQAHVANITAC